MRSVVNFIKDYFRHYTVIYKVVVLNETSCDFLFVR